jgi:Leucine-rich repeat (LRR) protein
LDISDTKITDAGLEHLKKLKELSMLVLYSTQVTDGGVAKLQKALPNLRIER